MPRQSRSANRTKGQDALWKEVKRLADARAREEHERWCQCIEKAREEAGLSRRELAALAGVDPSTIRNIEKRRGNSISQDTLNRLRNVSKLRLPVSLDDDEPGLTNSYRAIILPGYDDGYLQDQALESLQRSSARFPFQGLFASRKAIDLNHKITNTGFYGTWVAGHNRSTFNSLNALLKHINSPKLDLICFTVGHGWGEVDMADYIIYNNDKLNCRIYIVNESQRLVLHGLSQFRKSGLERQAGRLEIIPSFGSYESYLQSMPQQESLPKQRLFCLLGTLINIDNGIDLMRQISSRMNNGDLLFFDVIRSYDEDGDLKKVIHRDPRLSGRLPKAYVDTVEQLLEAGITSLDLSVDFIKWKYEVADCLSKPSRSGETYSVNMIGTLYRDKFPPQTISGMRIHRHNVPFLTEILRGMHLILAAEIPTGEDTSDTLPPLRSLLFVRRT